MFVHKRSLAAIVATAALALAALTFAAPSNAAPYVTAPELSVNTTAPRCAGPITKSGTGFVPGSTVSLSLVTSSGTVLLDTVVVHANGRFTVHEMLPAGVSGTVRIRAAGPGTATNSNTAEVTITIGACVAAPAAPPGIAFTGIDIFGMVAGVVVLLCIGGALVYLGRRRRTAA